MGILDSFIKGSQYGQGLAGRKAQIAEKIYALNEAVEQKEEMQRQRNIGELQNQWQYLSGILGNYDRVRHMTDDEIQGLEGQGMALSKQLEGFGVNQPWVPFTTIDDMLHKRLMFYRTDPSMQMIPPAVRLSMYQQEFGHHFNKMQVLGSDDAKIMSGFAGDAGTGSMSNDYFTQKQKTQTPESKPYVPEDIEAGQTARGYHGGYVPEDTEANGGQDANNTLPSNFERIANDMFSDSYNEPEALEQKLKTFANMVNLIPHFDNAQVQKQVMESIWRSMLKEGITEPFTDESGKPILGEDGKPVFVLEQFLETYKNLTGMSPRDYNDLYSLLLRMDEDSQASMLRNRGIDPEQIGTIRGTPTASSQLTNDRTILKSTRDSLYKDLVQQDKFGNPNPEYTAHLVSTIDEYDRRLLALTQQEQTAMPTGDLLPAPVEPIDPNNPNAGYVARAYEQPPSRPAISGLTPAQQAAIQQRKQGLALQQQRLYNQQQGGEASGGGTKKAEEVKPLYIKQALSPDESRLVGRLQMGFSATTLHYAPNRVRGLLSERTNPRSKYWTGLAKNRTLSASGKLRVEEINLTEDAAYLNKQGKSVPASLQKQIDDTKRKLGRAGYVDIPQRSKDGFSDNKRKSLTNTMEQMHKEFGKYPTSKELIAAVGKIYNHKSLETFHKNFMNSKAKRK